MKANTLVAQIGVNIMGGLTPTYWRITNRDGMGVGSGTLQRCVPEYADYVMPYGYNDQSIHRCIDQHVKENMVSKEEIYAKFGCTLAELENHILPR